MLMPSPLSRGILFIVKIRIGHAAHGSGIHPLVLGLGTAFELYVGVIMAGRVRAGPVAMRATVASVVHKRAQEETSHWGTGGNQYAVVFNPG